MPPPNNPSQQKKKKGHTPRHQNAFAFQHNPKSKTTAKILASPNTHVCRRCHDKIEWRKQYRKYKPRTQHGRCNGCQKRNVSAAYHTICESCTQTSTKAKSIIEEELQSMKIEEEQPKLRACAVCVKEVALPDPEDKEDDNLCVSVGRIKLRERKTIERKLTQEGNKKPANEEITVNDEDGESLEETKNASSNTVEQNSDDEEDPFLKAVGGADQLLTGEAYQSKLLEQKKRQGVESGVTG